MTSGDDATKPLTVDSLKEWLGHNLTVEVSVNRGSYESGYVTVTVTTILDGEVISRSDDSTSIDLS